MKTLDVPSTFYYGFRTPTTQESEDIVRACEEESFFRTRVTGRNTTIWVLGILYFTMGVLCNNTPLRVLCLCVSALSIVDLVVFLVKRGLWLKISWSVSRGDYAVKVARGYFPVVKCNRSRVTIESGDGVAVEAPSFYIRTKKMHDESWGDSPVLVVIIGGVHRLAVIPTRLEYEYI